MPRRWQAYDQDALEFGYILEYCCWEPAGKQQPRQNLQQEDRTRVRDAEDKRADNAYKRTAIQN